MAEIPEKDILEYDFCTEHRAEWRWQNEMLELNDRQKRKKVQVPKPVGATKIWVWIRVWINKVVVIPASCEKLVEGNLLVNCTEIEGVIEPDATFMSKYAIGIAAVLCKGHSGQSLYS